LLDVPSLTFTRRDFLKLSAAAAALAGAGCSQPAEPIVPYAEQPEGTLPGLPLFYATAASFTGAAEGLLVESNEGRPTKVEGNAAHPGSLGATSVHGQASVLGLWDPERSKTPRRRGAPATGAQCEAELAAALARLQPRRGEGLALLAGTVSSPTLLRQLDALRERYPRASVHRWDPLHRDASRGGARLAFGRPLEALCRLEQAGAILSLDSRFLDEHPYRLHYARQLARARTPREGAMTRLYALESAPSLVGAVADHRYAMAPAAIEAWLLARDERYRAIWRDLKAHRGAILAGESLSPRAHALVHRLNRELDAPVGYVDAVDPYPQPHARSIAALAAAMRAGAVELLVILGGNPAYDAPVDLSFAEALGRVPLSLHLSLYDDETSAGCTWHLPATHFMEHWSDERAFDGTASIVQPLIAPLYGGVSPHELLAQFAGEPRSGHDIVRETWRAVDWEQSLRKGVVAGTAFRPQAALARSAPAPEPRNADGWTLLFAADANVLDGRFANNAWLQELPRSHTKLTWDNAVLLSPASAQKLGVETGARLDIALGGRRLTAPAWLLPGHPDDCLTLPLGHGRTRAGSVGSRVGFDANALRATAAPWSAVGAQVAKAAGRHAFATTQDHSRMEGRGLARTVRLGEGKALFEAPPPSLYPAWPDGGYRWGMSIDLNACIGCNACTIACQAENNIPSVGKDQVIAGRAMHWIRVDRYHEEAKGGPRTLFQPVPCMHCENAPCEYVCPVEASVHDSEGLNVQVYNRCVGTRFCSQNCPYKVRRFNFLEYSKPDESLKAQKNPEVTVRMRGVMEKCTYCVQRISRARIEAEKEDRRIRDGEVVTACQAACPTQAIAFGDLADPASAVNRAKSSPLQYHLLAELNTRPRTSYAARVLNPNPELDD
jgi:molybdopterin-containing oxidoreductase family iron-sulfur binding subunit